MNVPPKDAIRVPASELRILVAALLERVGVGEADRSLLADLLVKNDLRGVFSHGSRQVATYARDIRDVVLHFRVDACHGAELRHGCSVDDKVVRFIKHLVHEQGLGTVAEVDLGGGRS